MMSAPDQNPRILVVDDDEMLRKLICRALTQAGFPDVTTASNGQEGLDWCARQRFDLIICDILMPEMDGLEMIFAVRKQYPDTRIIAMSGGGRLDAKNYLRLATTIGVDTLEKPFDTAVLIQMVKRLPL